jgi:predicted alpha-1,2-mannosidase
MQLSFPESQEERRLLIDLLDAEGELRMEGTSLFGYTQACQPGSAPESFKLSFIVDFDCPVLFEKSGIENNLSWVELDLPASRQVTVRIATSYLGREQCRLNLQRELGTRSFEQVAAVGAEIWNTLLGQIEVEGLDIAQQRTFYSCLYRASLFPRATHEFDADERQIHYSFFDDGVHDGPMYTDNGYWDTFRTVYPLLSILHPQRLAEMTEAWLNIYRESGWLPKWPSPGHTGCMIGSHIDAVLADAFSKGIPANWELALEGMIKHANEEHPTGRAGRSGVTPYLELGFVPHDELKESSSRTMDFAYDDWCIAQVAKGVGRTELYEEYMCRSKTYCNVFDPGVGFMRGRNRDGSWVEPFNPIDWGGSFVEGSVWQCGWAVQHDIQGLIELMGGRRKFLKKLHELLDSPPRFNIGTYPAEIHEMSEMAAVDFGQYAHSNQPSHHVLYLFTVAGEPATTQRWVRRVMAELYNAGPRGFCGDEDNGEMAAWYVFNALGFYPLTPGQTEYTLGSPLVSLARVYLENGNCLEVDAPNNGPQNIYVKEALHNDHPCQNNRIDHHALISGGSLRFVMQDHPHSD